MKEKIKIQKGFVQIPLLIIIIASIVATSIVADIVLHKQKKPSIGTANISQVFKETEKIQPEESTAEQEPKESQMNRELEEKWQEGGKIKEGKEEKITINLPKKEKMPDYERKSEPESQSETQFSEQRDVEPEEKSDPCANVDCPVCQYCLNGNCVARPDNYNDCGSGCQRCVNGSCQDYNGACSNCQYCESDKCVSNCKGTDIHCGCVDCINCNEKDGWIDVGSTYSCCDGNKKCICQKQEYRDYSCSKTSCTYLVAKTKINKSDCSECGFSKTCLHGICQDIFSTSLYSSMLIGDFVHQLNFSFLNNSSQTITVTKVEFLNKDGKVIKTVSADDIARIWQDGKIEPGKSLSGSISFQLPPSIKAVKEWRTKWYCLDSNESPFTVSGGYSLLDLDPLFDLIPR